MSPIIIRQANAENRGPLISSISIRIQACSACWLTYKQQDTEQTVNPAQWPSHAEMAGIKLNSQLLQSFCTIRVWALPPKSLVISWYLHWREGNSRQHVQSSPGSKIPLTCCYQALKYLPSVSYLVKFSWFFSNQLVLVQLYLNYP
jgi:hypothetical protein